MLRACHRSRDRAAIAKVFAETRRKKAISHIFRTFRRIREVESYAPSKFQPPTTLGDHQNVEKTNRAKIEFLGFQNLVFHNFSWNLEGIDNFKRQNRFPRETLLQIHLF